MSSGEYEKAEQEKILDEISLAAGATKDSKTIVLENMEMIVITAQVKYEAGADVSVQVRLKFCPPGGIWDSIAYTSFYLTYTADAEVKRSVPVDVPAMGLLKVELYNGDNQATGRARVWYTTQRRRVQ